MSELNVFTRNSMTGRVALLETHANDIAGVTGLGGASSVAASDDGRHVYVAGGSDNTVAVFTTVAPCAGDCDLDGVTTVSELVTGINIALQSVALERCRSLDADEDGGVRIDELLLAVQNGLAGCAA